MKSFVLRLDEKGHPAALLVDDNEVASFTPEDGDEAAWEVIGKWVKDIKSGLYDD